MSSPFPPRVGPRVPLPSPGNIGGWLSVPVIIAGVIAIIIFMSYTPIAEGEVGVKVRWGQAVEVLKPGFNIVLPFAESVVRLPTRREIYRPEAPLNAYSKEIQAANCTVSVNYSVDPAKAIAVYQRYGENFVATIIAPTLNKRFKEVFGGYNAKDIVNQRVRLGQEVEKSIRDNMPDGILIETVQIENIDFSDAYEQAIEATAQAEAAVRKAQQELEQRKVDSEKIVVQANAEAQARVAQAKAEADATRLRGDAEAAAIQAKAAALRDNPGYVALTAAEKWDGKLPQTMVPGSAVPFVTVPRGAAPQ